MFVPPDNSHVHILAVVCSTVIFINLKLFVGYRFRFSVGQRSTHTTRSQFADEMSVHARCSVCRVWIRSSRDRVSCRIPAALPDVTNFVLFFERPDSVKYLLYNRRVARYRGDKTRFTRKTSIGVARAHTLPQQSVKAVSGRICPITAYYQ